MLMECGYLDGCERMSMNAELIKHTLEMFATAPTRTDEGGSCHVGGNAAGPL